MSVGGDAEPWVLDLGGAQLPPLAWVRQMGRGRPGGMADDHLDAVLLVCTELATNAYDHRRGARTIRLQRGRTPCRVRVEVDDASSAQPVLGRSRLGEHRGRVCRSKNDMGQ